MTRSNAEAVEALLEETAAAHHAAFIDTDGFDPEWPLWYATYLADRLPAVATFMGSRSELVYWLVRLDEEHRAADSSVPWARYYAVRIAAL